MKFSTRMQLTFGLFTVLVGLACTAKQMNVVHDALDGVHGFCESADPAIHLVLTRLEDGGSNDTGSGKD